MVLDVHVPQSLKTQSSECVELDILVKECVACYEMAIEMSLDLSSSHEYAADLCLFVPRHCGQDCPETCGRARSEEEVPSFLRALVQAARNTCSYEPLSAEFSYFFQAPWSSETATPRQHGR